MKARKCILFIFSSLAFFTIQAQNLISNGSFENLQNSQCTSPQEGILKVDHWYSIEGTPDLFIESCPVSSIGEIFWSTNSAAYDGRNFMGFKCRVNSNQSYLSEGVATELSQSLESDEAYYLTFKIRNKGIYQGFPASVISCPLKPEKRIEVYAHTDSIEVVNDFSNGSASSNGDLVAAVESPAMQSDDLIEEWIEVGTCFLADDNISHLSLIMPLGNFGTFPACSADDTKGTFFSYYFEIDDIFLGHLPEDTLITRYIEDGQSTEIYIPAELDLPFISDASINWSDGFVGSRRTLEEAGSYELDVVLSCGIIPVTLELIPLEKEFPFFIPNIFSPNEDGINDELEIFIPSDKSVNSFFLSVFDRWGNKVFESKNIDKLWDGKSTTSASSGQFIYYLTCSIQDQTGTQNYSKTDVITIIR